MRRRSRTRRYIAVAVGKSDSGFFLVSIPRAGLPQSQLAHRNGRTNRATLLPFGYLTSFGAGSLGASNYTGDCAVPPLLVIDTTKVSDWKLCVLGRAAIETSRHQMPGVTIHRATDSTLRESHYALTRQSSRPRPYQGCGVPYCREINVATCRSARPQNVRMLRKYRRTSCCVAWAE